MESSVSGKRLLLFLGGPALLLVALALPCFGPLNARFAFGILFWMVWWWVTTVVDINRLLKQFEMMQKLTQQMTNMTKRRKGKKGGMGGLAGLGSLFGGGGGNPFGF